MVEKQLCDVCKSRDEDILLSGFVGCENCYNLTRVKLAVKELYGNKTHRGKVVKNRQIDGCMRESDGRL